LFIAVGPAWLIALLSYAQLNVTPLCIGQNNGDETNSSYLSILYRVLVAFVYSLV
jgi:hypothetical protein